LVQLRGVYQRAKKKYGQQQKSFFFLCKLCNAWILKQKEGKKERTKKNQFSAIKKYAERGKETYIIVKLKEIIIVFVISYRIIKQLFDSCVYIFAFFLSYQQINILDPSACT
jgi:hypothetical protein